MDQDNIIAAAEDILTRRYGGTQKLVDATRLTGSGFAAVYRARVSSNPLLQHRSVVVKYSPETGDVLDDAAFLREVVSYQFTTSLSEDVRPGPILLGHDTAKRIIIISDSGDGDTLESLLMNADDETRLQVLRGLGTALGRMHAGTAGKEDAYNVLFARMVRGRKGQRQVQDLRERILMHRIRLGATMLEESGIAIPAEISDTAEKIHARLLRGGNRAFTPFDLAPDNIIFAERTQFLDYEWAGFRDVTFDVAFVVGGFPNYVATRPVNDDEARVFVDAWVSEVETMWPNVLHEKTLHAAITSALIGWALSSVSILNANALESIGQSDSQLEEEFRRAGADLEAAVRVAEDFEVSGDLLRPRSDGPFTPDEQLVRRDLFETFDAVARYAALGSGPANRVVSEWARGVAGRLR
ncbi:phosphotransferase [Corynebacterium auris]|uniref:phosphotransferase n=1 Tax=Corynebacterium auris TaxID=44750 RepID=UPI0025B5564A|nr:phosphotransferase [Corynebacterium auris]WJY68164.1 Phosphotransferase enzyme family protein [Corynebacterium auris]